MNGKRVVSLARGEAGLNHEIRPCRKSVAVQCEYANNYYFEARNRERLADKLTQTSTTQDGINGDIADDIFHSIKTLDMENYK